MNDAQFNFVFGLVVGAILFWFLPLMWRRVMPKKFKSSMMRKPAGKKTAERTQDEELGEELPSDATDIDIQIKPKRVGNYKGRTPGSRNKPKNESQEADAPPATKGMVKDFVMPPDPEELRRPKTTKK